MKTVYKPSVPKADCLAYENGECKILTATYCALSQKCGHYKTQSQYMESIKKASERCCKIGKKNNRVSGH